MLEHEDILRKTLDVLERMGIRYMIVGSVASSLYGEPRATIDVDIVIDIPCGLAEEFCRSFPGPEFYLEPSAVRKAIQTGGQFNLIQSTTADKVDFMILRHGAQQEEAISRPQRRRVLPDRDGFVARPEDVILSKMEYYREGGSEKHLRDITGILRISSSEIDQDYVAERARRLGLSDIWQAILRRLEAKGA